MSAPLPPCFGIIPARYGSRRFPGKPLVNILGKPMFVHVYERASACPEMEKVYLATDDWRIEAAANAHCVPVIMTSPGHKSGTDRVNEAAEKLGLPEHCVVVNIQGDEPALDPKMISRLLAPFSDPKTRVTTPAGMITLDQAKDPNRVKVVRAGSGLALYFSRAKIPYDRAGDAPKYLGHIGLYAFRRDVLNAFSNMMQSPLEKMEKLEQLRLLEAGIPIHVVLTDYVSRGVDTPEDVAEIIEILENE